ncbi:MAG: DUF4920 domain-containing protein [Chitinophagaceae bacterium]
MKKIFVCIAMLGFSICVSAQDPAPADKGVTYGAGTTEKGAVPVSQIEANMKEAKFTGKTTGKVLSVCMEKGCWMKVEKAGGETMMVKFKDYGFFMPKDIVGKDVVLDGEASVKETSVKQLKHYAEDAGKSKDEISKITAPKKELIFTAKGVLVL